MKWVEKVPTEEDESSRAAAASEDYKKLLVIAGKANESLVASYKEIIKRVTKERIELGDYFSHESENAEFALIPGKYWPGIINFTTATLGGALMQGADDQIKAKFLASFEKFAQRLDILPPLAAGSVLLELFGMLRKGERLKDILESI